jgi:hypothetical protein
MRNDGRFLLRLTGTIYLIGWSLHTADHLRRGIDAVSSEVFWAGNVSGVIALVAIGMAFAGHRLAPIAAIAGGLPAAVGVAAVHLLPGWGVFSDSLPDGHVDGFTWVAVLVEIGGALVFGLAGLVVARRAGWHTFTLRRHPAAPANGR